MFMRATKEEKQQDVLLQLYDLYWFKYDILANQEEEHPKPKLHPIRSLSDQSLSSKEPINFNGAHSPSSILASSAFHSEPPYHNAAALEQVKKKKKENGKIKRRRVRRCCKISKGLSEIKGFMDLGFEFSEEDKRSPRLVSILPGLQRLGNNGGNGLKKKKNPRFPSLCDEDGMKNHLKMWVQAVASVVRLEHELVSISSSFTGILSS